MVTLTRRENRHIRKRGDANLRSLLAGRWNHLRCILGLLGCAVLLAACAVPSPAASPVSSSDAVILTDEFSPPNAAWARFDTEENAVYVQGGELYLEDRGKGVAVYAPLSGKAYDDVVVDVQVRHVQGTVNDWMGVICRQQDEENYYLLAISADGFYLILRVEDGTNTALAGPKINDVINQGKAKNDIMARCQGNSLSLRVNGAFVVARTDTALSAPGQVALFADAVESGETATIAFDDFKLSTP